MTRLFAILLLALCWPVAAQTTGAPPSISVETFATPSAASMARLSPDGTKVAALRTGRGSDFVFVFDVSEPSKIIKRIDIGNYSLADLVWANNERLLLHPYFTVSFLGLSFGEAKLMVADLGEEETRRLDGPDSGFRATDILYIEPSGRWALIAGLGKFDKSPAIMRVDLVSGEFVEVQESLRDVWNWFVDEKGVVRGGLSFEGLRWALWYRNKADEPLVKLRGKFDKKDVDVIERVYMSPIGGNNIVISNHATGRFAAYDLDFQNVEPGALVFENPNGDLDDLLVDPASHQIVGFRYHDKRWRTHWLDADLKRAQVRLDKAFPTTDNQILDWSNDRSRLLILASKPDDPGVYYVLDRTKGEMKIVLVPFQRLPEKGLAPVKYVEYQARDGLKIPGFLTIPYGKQEKDLPLILFPHGGPFARDTWDYDPWVQFFANRGYAVFQPQFRGTTGFGRQFVEQGFGEWGTKMQDDLDDGLEWLIGKGVVDPKRVCIAGASYGGYAALWGAIRSPEHFRCAISWAGVTDLKMMLKHDKTLFGAPRYYRNWRERVVGMERSRRDLDDVSPLKNAARLKIPLLLGHGKRDDNVPFEQGEEMVNAMRKAGLAVDTAYYDKQGHTISGTDFADWLWQMEKFLARHNPTDRLTPATVSAFPSKKEGAKDAPSTDGETKD